MREPASVLHFCLVTVNGSGAAVAPDAPPTFKLFRGTAAGNPTHDNAVTFEAATNPETGIYSTRCTLPEGYAEQDGHAALATWAVGGTSYKKWCDPLPIVSSVLGNLEATTQQHAEDISDMAVRVLFNQTEINRLVGQHDNFGLNISTAAGTVVLQKFLDNEYFRKLIGSFALDMTLVSEVGSVKTYDAPLGALYPGKKLRLVRTGNAARTVTIMDV